MADWKNGSKSTRPPAMESHDNNLGTGQPLTQIVECGIQERWSGRLLYSVKERYWSQVSGCIRQSTISYAFC